MSRPVKLPPSANGIEVNSLEKAFGGAPVLDCIDLSVVPGEFMAVLGPSGCGKTTLLRIIAGLLGPDSGSVRIGGETVVDSATGFFMPAERRRLGMVFQDYALWPHMRVRENVAFPLESRKVSAVEKGRLVGEALHRVGLGALAERFPAELSGGQQQRVSLARAIAGSPRLLLFDEPLSNLDTALRDSLGQEIARLTRELGLTALYVTHDQSEALSLADRVAVMREGRVVQLDTPERLYRDPRDAWVADFLRAGSLVSGRLTDAGFVPSGACGAINVPSANGYRGAARLLVPVSAVRVGGGKAGTEVVVTQSRFKGERYEILARWPGSGPEASIHFWHDAPVAPDTRLPIAFVADRMRLFPDTA